MAKIVGGTASTTMPLPDWNQTDPRKADYIKNKPFGKVDDELNADSTNPVQNKVVTAKINELGQTATWAHEHIQYNIDPRLTKAEADIADLKDSSITVDDKLSTTSANPVQNKVVTEAFNEVATDFLDVNTNIEELNERVNEVIAAGEASRTMAEGLKGAIEDDIYPRLTAVEEDVAELKEGVVAIPTDYVTPQMFGAKGDGGTDDTAAIQAAMDANYTAYAPAPDGTGMTEMTVYYPVYIPAGTYLVDGYYKDFLDSPNGGIKLHSGQRVYMDANCVIKVKTNNGAFYNAFNVYGCENVEIHGGKIVGERDDHDPEKHNSHPDRTQGFGIAVQNSDNVLIENVDISEMWGDAIVLHTPDNLTGYNSNITIRNCYLHDCERQGISVVVGDNVLISNCVIGNISGHAPQSGIDIEPHSQATEDMYVHDVTIENCKFIDNVQSLCFSRCYNLTVHNCVFGEHVAAVQLVDNVKFNNCDMRTAYIQGDCSPNFYGCKIGTVCHESTGTPIFHNCYISGRIVDFAYCITGKKMGKALFKNCEFMLKLGGPNKESSRFMNNPVPCRFEGCTFATVDGEAVRLFANIADLEFYGCTIDVPTSNSYLLLNPTKLVMQNCNVKTSKQTCYYYGEVTNESNYVSLIGNHFEQEGTVAMVFSEATFTNAPTITAVNNTRNNVQYFGFVLANGYTVTDINNNKI